MVINSKNTIPDWIILILLVLYLIPSVVLYHEFITKGNQRTEEQQLIDQIQAKNAPIRTIHERFQNYSQNNNPRRWSPNDRNLSPESQILFGVSPSIDYVEGNLDITQWLNHAEQYVIDEQNSLARIREFNDFLTQNKHLLEQSYQIAYRDSVNGVLGVGKVRIEIREGKDVTHRIRKSSEGIRSTTASWALSRAHGIKNKGFAKTPEQQARLEQVITQLTYLSEVQL